MGFAEKLTPTYRPLLLVLSLLALSLAAAILHEPLAGLFEGIFDAEKVNFLIGMASINFFILAILVYAAALAKKHIISPRANGNETKKFAELLLLMLVIFVGAIFANNLAFKLEVIEQSEGVKWHHYIILPLKLEKDILVELQNSLVLSELNPERLEIPVYRLYVRDSHLLGLDSNLPFSGMDYVPGNFQVDQNVLNAKVRYRGDNYYHWGGAKKSWRIKLKDGQFYNGANTFNLISPKYPSYMIAPLTTKLLSEANVAAPRSYNAALYLNNNYAGVYEYVDQPDETFLRQNGLLPGDIYAGDKPKGTNEWITKEQQSWIVFDDPERWDISATFDNNDSRAMENIAYLLENVNSPDANNFYEFYNSHLGDEHLELLAERTLIYDIHLDNRHNHRLYFDPSSGHYLPIGWDQQVERINDDSTPDMFSNRIDRQILKFPQLIHKKNELLFSLISRFDENDAIGFIEENKGKLEEPMLYDNYKQVIDWPLSKNMTMADWNMGIVELESTIKFNYSYIRRKLSETDVRITLAGSQASIDVNGISGVTIKSPDGLCLQAKRQLPGASYYCLGSDESPDTELYPGRNIRISKIKLGRFFYDSESIEANAISYVFDLNSPNALSDFESLKYYNAVTGEEIRPRITQEENLALSQLNFLSTNYSEHPWNYNEPEKREVVWSGDVVLEGQNVFSKNDTIIIEPGTTLKMQKDASLIIFGTLVAKGTEENPITITSYSEEPWGSIALQGDYSRAEFEWVDISNGSGTKYGGVTYTGMISIYNASATLDHVRLSDNKIYDDMLNAKRAAVSIRNSEFFNSFSDAVDFDIMKSAEISSSSFRKSGGDAIDLSTTISAITDVNISNAGDKGVSIGEASNPVIRGIMISDSNIGIAIKDGSDPEIFSPVIRSSNIAIASYMKNWRYGGGALGTIYNGDFCDNSNVLEMDGVSKTTFIRGGSATVCTSSACNLGCLQ